MVIITDIPQKQRLHVMDSYRYSVRNAEVFDEVARRFITADDIEIMEDR